MLADTDGGEGVGGTFVSGLHTFHVTGDVSFSMPKVVAPFPADEVMSPEGGYTVPQLTSAQHLSRRYVEVVQWCVEVLEKGACG